MLPLSLLRAVLSHPGFTTWEQSGRVPACSFQTTGNQFTPVVNLAPGMIIERCCRGVLYLGSRSLFGGNSIPCIKPHRSVDRQIIEGLGVGKIYLPTTPFFLHAVAPLSEVSWRWGEYFGR